MVLTLVTLILRVVAVKQDVEALTHLGNVYQRLGRTHDACSIFSHLVRKLPDDTRLLLKYVSSFSTMLSLFLTLTSSSYICRVLVDAAFICLLNTSLRDHCS